jgi:hypothetical protein
MVSVTTGGAWMSILQHANGTISLWTMIFEQGKNMKLLLCAFEQLSGLIVNFD